MIFSRRMDLSKRFSQLIRIGIALSSERRLPKLLDLILSEARAFTHAEGGTLYLRKGNVLVFWVVQNEVLQKRDPHFKRSLKNHTLSLDLSSLCGQAALEGNVLNIPDVSKKSETEADRKRQEFDRLNQYQTRSMVVIPLSTPQGETIGVMQLINARTEQGQVIPFDPSLEELLRALASQAAVAIQNTQLNEELHLSYQDTLQRLAVAVEHRDDATAMHIHRMSHYSALIAQAYGLPEDQVEEIRLASPMHDLGKIGIPDAVLLKPGSLTPDEFEVMKNHPRIGAHILGNSRMGVLKLAETIALTHHEKFDGTGYPQGLKGDAIPLAGRIVAVADVFDALMTKRCYKPAFSLEVATDIIVKGSGTHFDPAVVNAFMSVHDKIKALQIELEKNHDQPFKTA